MRIAIGADHAGFGLKNDIRDWLRGLGYIVEDLGAHSLDPKDDYPDFVYPVAEAIASKRAEKGIVVCGSGVGANVTANKIRGVRASVCHDVYSAHQGVEHDDMNVLCLGARVVSLDLAKELVKSFLNAKFTGEERHRRRLQKVLDIESGKGTRSSVPNP